MNNQENKQKTFQIPKTLRVWVDKGKFRLHLGDFPDFFTQIKKKVTLWELILRFRMTFLKNPQWANRNQGRSFSTALKISPDSPVIFGDSLDFP